MPIPRLKIAPLVAALVLTLTSSLALASLVSFSEQLLNHISRRFNQDAVNRLLIWQRLVLDLKKNEGPLARQGDFRAEAMSLRKTNDFFNQVPYRTDLQHWGREDYWATPIELLGSFGGDCEDYAIGKYLSLKDLGVPIDRLRISYVYAKSAAEPHMVLAYYATPDAEPWIMDNLIKEIRPASQRHDLEPVYSFNDDDIWTAGGITSKGGASQVRLWKELREKLSREQL